MSNTDFDTLPDCALLRLRQLTPNGPVPFAAVTVWRKVKDGTFPAPIRLSEGRITAWRWGDVRAWLEAQGSERRAA